MSLSNDGAVGRPELDSGEPRIPSFDGTGLLLTMPVHRSPPGRTVFLIILQTDENIGGLFPRKIEPREEFPPLQYRLSSRNHRVFQAHQEVGQFVEQ